MPTAFLRQAVIALTAQLTNFFPVEPRADCASTCHTGSGPVFPIVTYRLSLVRRKMGFRTVMELIDGLLEGRDEHAEGSSGDVQELEDSKAHGPVVRGYRDAAKYRSSRTESVDDP
ncbi:unnamed protein product [Haemonchus placei]|uniref:Uncharacterized protein n=1 Tax=Haemonchus placei TaxID=6290 RepID=A0A0N4WWV7_HAEPC|nr:unnamed protein product [Haemonchus placei]